MFEVKDSSGDRVISDSSCFDLFEVLRDLVKMASFMIENDLLSLFDEKFNIFHNIEEDEVNRKEIIHNTLKHNYSNLS